MKKVFFVYSKNKLKNIVDYSKKHDCILISLTSESDFLLTKENIVFKSIKSYNVKEQPYRELYLKRRKLLSEWGKIKISGKTLEKHLTINDVSLWDLLENELGELNLEVIISYVDIICRIIELEKPDIIFFSEDEKLYFVHRDRIFFPDLIKAVSEKYAIISKCISCKFNINKHLQKILNHSISFAAKYREIQRTGYKRCIFNESKKKVLFFHYGGHMKTMAPIQHILVKKDIDVVSICGGGISSNTCLDFFSEHNNKNMMYAYLESFSNQKIKEHTKKKKKEFSALWLIVDYHKQKFSYNGVIIFNIIKNELYNVFNLRLFSLTRLVFLMDNALSEIMPNMVVTLNESFFFGKCAALCAKKNNIKSILIQHAKSPDIFSLITPISDYICTWDDLDKRSLAKGVDSKKFFALGSSKYKLIPNQMKSHNRNNILSELNIGLNNKIILFAARFSITRDYFRINEIAKYVDSDKNKNIMLIVKLHPADIAVTLKELKKMFPYINIIFIRQFDFVKLLSIADVVVSTQECTTSLDTLIAEKPLITIAYEDSFDQPFTEIPSYSKNSPFILAKNTEELKKNITTLLNNVNESRMLLKRIHNYNNKHFDFKNSEEEIADFIIKHLN
jgi:hypothetical protein